jgi:predicted transcriptional regulator
MMAWWTAIASVQGEDVRHRILDLIEAEAGIYKSELCLRTNLSWGAITYHLAVLKRSGRIAFATHGRLTRIFPAEVPSRDFRWMAVLRDAETEQIYDYLEGKPAIQIYNLTKELGISRKIIRRHLTNLQDAGLVIAEPGSRPRFRAVPANQEFSPPPTTSEGQRERR